ncbi:hypothetical protein BCEP4_2040020 [Burkholderia cepacia]|nr:hypothetical protein BCEP4_2040020 [Burkholderia cepacia]
MILLWAVSSAVEHCLHTAGVTGSIPVPPTKTCDKGPALAGPLFFQRFSASRTRHLAKCSLSVLSPDRILGTYLSHFNFEVSGANDSQTWRLPISGDRPSSGVPPSNQNLHQPQRG